MAETLPREANAPPQRPFRALSKPPPNGRHAVGDNALRGQLGAPLRAAASCYANASFPIVQRPSGGSPERALKGLCGAALASLRAISAISERPVSRLATNCYHLANS
eukprot:8335456-Alexandrium_andersonii.AAC.1